MNQAEKTFAKKLVLEVQQRPVLYDSKTPGYKDKQRVKEEWREVAVVMGTTADVVKKRWTNLRGSYSKALAAIKLSNGSVAKKTRTFYLMKQMSFLKNFMYHLPTLGNVGFSMSEESQSVPEDQEEAETGLVITVEDMSQPGPSHALSPTTPSSTTSSSTCDPISTKRKKKRKQGDANNEGLEHAAASFLKDRLNQEVNPDLEFFKGLLPQVSELTKKNKRKFFTDVTVKLMEALDQQEEEEERSSKGNFM